MKKLIATLGLAFLLTGCFGSTTDNVNLTSFEGKGFTMQVPKTWVAYDLKDLPKPGNGEIAGAFNSTDFTSGFSNNLLILEGKLDNLDNSDMTSAKYILNGKSEASKYFTEYTPLSMNNVKFSDGDEGRIATFEARYNKTTPTQKFLQSAKVCGKKVYLMTIGLNLDNNSTDKYAEMFKTFTCK